MYSSRVAHVHGNALTCSISSMVERSPSRTAHVWLTCTVMPSCVAFPQWWRDSHVWDLLTCGGDIHVWDLLTCGGDIHVWLMCMVMPSCVAFPQWWRGAFMYSSHVAHVHGNALTCSISSMVERSPSCTAHVWLMCTVMPSCVAFPQWWRDIHVWDLPCAR